ncbi:MAG: alpha/beta hydrolase [Pseudomonadota bacterium]
MQITRRTRFSDRINREIPPIGEFVEVDGVKIHLKRAGSPDAMPLVLLHGASGNLRDWTSSVFDELAAKWHVIAIDRPGYGHSDFLADETWMIAPQTRLLRTMMTKLGYDRYALFGHSYGVAVALDWALTRPKEVAGILAMSGAMISWGGALGWRYRLGGVAVLGSLMGKAVPLIASDTLIERELAEVFEPQPVPSDYVERGGVALALKPATFALNLRAMDRLHAQTSATLAKVPTISCPVEVLHGGADAIVPHDPETGPIASLAPTANTVILPGVGHMPHHTDPQSVYEATDRLRGSIGATE